MTKYKRLVPHHSVVWITVGLLLTGCTAGDDGGGGSTPQTTQPEAVSFSTDLGSKSSRVTTGTINNTEALKKVGEGFGVFAYLTDDKKWADADLSEFKNFFMQNQQVTWGVQWVDDKGDTNPANDENKYDWVYYPLKYWPNYTDNDNTIPGAPRYVSFFAYAPWADATTHPEAGVIDYVRNGDRLPHVIYKLGAPNQQVDLLWAKAVDTKRNGNGLITVDSTDPENIVHTYQKVPLEFHHALSAIDIYVQRVYDEPAYTGKIPNAVLYPTLYISKLELTSTTAADDGKNGLQLSGRFDLEDGTWSDPGAPNAWSDLGDSDPDDDEVKLIYDETMLNDTLRGTTSTDPDVISDIELDKWKWVLDTHNNDDPADDEWVDATTISESELAATPNRWKDAYGVSEVERNLIKNTMTQVLIPRKVTLIPTLTYSMVVRDDALLVDYLTDSEGHKYTRIINEVPGNSVTLDLVAGKRYTLLIRIGVEHISFELVSVVDWDFPMRFTPDVVRGFEEDEIGHILNE